MENIRGKSVIIMGASSGIGAATVKKLAEEGAKLTIAARREERLKELVKEMPEAEIEYVVCDVARFEEVERVKEVALQKYGKIDVLFNNAGVMPLAPLIETRRDEWQYMIDINITGVLNGIAAVLPVMVKQQSGHIISTGSVAGHVVFEGASVYCGTKWALRAIMEGLRQEQRENNIKSTLISPGAVTTELYNSINDEETRKAHRENAEQPGFGISSEQVADAIAYVIGTKENLAISDMILRPTKQPV